jgi:glyoxylase-like metal-dependent hydrolase (beta-lactamase superfamily II)
MSRRVTAKEIATGVYGLPLRGSNVYFVASGSSWALVDAGWGTSATAIREAGAAVFGPGSRPSSILLTHAHPDHTGAASELALEWDVPVYVHEADLPLLVGDAMSNVRVDPIGRAFGALVRLLPGRLAVALERSGASRFHATALTFEGERGAVPGLPGWEYIAAPGHSPGHVVFWRESDRVALVGDAVLTAPLWGALTPVRRLSLPAWPASWDWQKTKASAALVAGLEPYVLATGHGAPMSGIDLAPRLHAFAARVAKSGEVADGS